ncbi:MAG: DUF1836 domain-containing protein [Bacilli bacterium]|jgi:hypothetical protein|nr:DUF1836 domain-containing protein [Acholeplasmataceae bacterium]
MNDIKANLELWLENFTKVQLPNWDKLPDIDLYMDQVVTYIISQLQIDETEKESILTPSMVNNYVKSGALPSPIQKKYNKEHLFYLIVFRTLKSVLSINSIKQLFDNIVKDNEISTIHDNFKNIFESLLQKTIQSLTSEINDDIDSLSQLALRLAIEAHVKKVIAEKIIELLILPKPQEETEKETEKDKNNKDKNNKDQKKKKEAKN